ncbi:MAG: hypothetical protein E7234_03235 [Lachnospiraceae bacterium]|jgi:hypothetical protein|nr:hypothetical protein [Lachnospiraceae bacterium]
MDRKPVRRKPRPTAAKKRKKTNRYAAARGYSLSEAIIIQSMICGVILLFFLILNLFNMPFTNNIKNGVKTAIKSNISEDGLEESKGMLATAGGGITSYIKNIFGIEEKNKNNDKDHTTENVFLNTGTPSDSNLRIDEDILKQMSTEENALLPEAVDTQKKSTVPLN